MRRLGFVPATLIVVPVTLFGADLIQSFRNQGISANKITGIGPGNYSLVQVGSTAAGYAGMNKRLKKIKSVDVTKQVSDHSAYCKSLSLK